MKMVELEVEEAGYMRRLLKEHVEYYRALCNSPKASEATRARAALVEGLWAKLR